ncbi:MAG: Hpt domain-containing protein [Rhodospirillaceae bacterium]
MAQEPEYIYPPNTLKNKVTIDASSVDASALAQAELAIGEMSEDYLEWVKDDLAALQAAYEKAVSDPASANEAKEDLHGYAHDIKGQGGSFGYPLMTAVGNQLAKFIESIPGTLTAPQLQVVKVHIDTLKLIIVDRMDGDGGKAGDRLLRALDAVIAKVQG